MKRAIFRMILGFGNLFVVHSQYILHVSNLTDIKYSIRFNKDEEAKYKELAKKLNRPLSIIIRDALDTICENPSLLNPTNPTLDIDILINALEISAKERKASNALIQKDTQEQFSRMDRKINYLLKKAKVSDKVLKKLDGEDTSGEKIFD